MNQLRPYRTADLYRDELLLCIPKMAEKGRIISGSGRQDVPIDPRVRGTARLDR